MIKATEYLFRNCLEKTAGVSLRIDEYLSYCGEVSELLKNQTASQNVSTQDVDGKDADSYVSTIGSSDAVMPSENYNDILKENKSRSWSVPELLRKRRTDIRNRNIRTDHTGIRNWCGWKYRRRWRQR